MLNKLLIAMADEDTPEETTGRSQFVASLTKFAEDRGYQVPRNFLFHFVAILVADYNL